MNFEDVQEKTSKLTFSVIQKYIEDTHNVKVSKSSITQVKDKCKIEKLEAHAKNAIVADVKTEKEMLVLQAFKHFEIV